MVTFSPLFFVLMGARVDPGVLVHGRTLMLALVLAVLGTAGRFVAGCAAGKGLRPAVVGWGMVPRGEVGIIGALLITTIIGPAGLGRVLPSGKACVPSSGA